VSIDPLTDREEEVLAHLARLRFLTAGQLEEFLFGASRVKARSRAVMTQRVLGSLKRRRLVAMRPRIVGGPEFGEGRPTYHLSPAGVRASRALYAAAPLPRMRSTGAFLARHALATAEVILAFRRAAQATVGHELVTWECDWQAALALGSSVLEPDAYVMYRAEDQRLHAFIEVDMGTEYGRFVSQKMRRYLELHRTVSWRARLPVWPLILFVTPTDARSTQLQRQAEAISRLPGGQWDVGASFRFAALDSVTADRGPVAAIWHVVGRAGVHSLIPDRTPVETATS
jgi:hypothetical protein